jgi:hypothetical protein
MPDALDLTGDTAAAIDGAALRQSTLAVAYVRPDGSPSVSFRGSTQVHSSTARVAPELNDEVWSVLIEVDTVAGAGAGGFFQQARA